MMSTLNEQLSRHFTLKELTKTTSGLVNQPESPEIAARLATLCREVLEPIRNHFARPVIIHSGYRCAAVNSAVGGSKSSQHLRGEAADFHVSGYTVYEVARWISDNLDYDQVILEDFLPEHASSGWVHCSYARNNRNQDLTKFKNSKKYYPGLLLKPE